MNTLTALAACLAHAHSIGRDASLRTCRKYLDQIGEAHGIAYDEHGLPRHVEDAITVAFRIGAEFDKSLT